MQSRTRNFYFGLPFDFNKDNVFLKKYDVTGAVIPPVLNNFLLLDGTDFLLLDNTNFLLL